VFRGASELAVGAYGELGIEATPRLQLIPGLRLDTYLLDGQYRESIDPRLAARYKVSPAWTLKGYLGRFTQPPLPEVFDRRFGNPKINPEYGNHYGVGYEWKPDPLWSIDSEIYFSDRRDVVVSTDDVVANPDGTFTRLVYNNGARKYAYGFEAIIKREISDHAFGWLSYTFSRARVRLPGEEWTPTRFDQPHVLNAVASYKPGHNFELGAKLQLASGRPDTPIIGGTYNSDTGKFEPLKGADRSVRVPTFYQLDVRAEKDWLYDTWSLGLYLDVINVLNTQNVEAIEYDYRFRQSAPITSFPILPTLGLRGTW